MVFIKRLLHFIERWSDWTGKLLAPLVVFIMGIVLYEVLCRYGLNKPTIWAHEITAFIFGIQFIIGGAYCLFHGSMVNVDVIQNKLSPRNKAILDVLTFPFLFFVCAAMIWYGSSVAWDSIKTLERSSTAFSPPLYPIRAAIPIGAFFLLLQGMAKFTRDIYMAFTGKELK